MSAELIGGEESTKENVNNPEVVHLAMPMQLFELLGWKDGDGLEWTYVDEDRVLLKRVAQEVTPVDIAEPSEDMIMTQEEIDANFQVMKYDHETGESHPVEKDPRTGEWVPLSIKGIEVKRSDENE